MRSSIFLLAACALAVGVLGDEEHKHKHHEEMKACLDEQGLTKDDFHKAMKARHDGQEPDQKFKCFEACMGKKMGMMVDGKANKDKMIEKLPADVPEREKKIEAITKCAELSGSDECETAYLVMKCLHENKVMPPPPHHHHHD